MTDVTRCKWAQPAAILVATDLSDLERTMPFAIEEAAATGARLVVLHVVAMGETLNADVAGNPFYDPLGAVEVATKELAPWVEMARQRGVACETLVQEGAPTELVPEVARKIHAGRIVVGTRSRGKISKLFLGSIAEQLVRNAHVPVITVGPEARWAPIGDERVVLHATQLLPNAKAHAELAECVATTLRAKLVLLHAVDPNLTADKEAEAKEALTKLAEGITGASVETQILHEYAPDAILAAAKERKANLIVLGSTPRSSLAEITRDRTVYRVLAHAHCPVMTLQTGKA